MKYFALSEASSPAAAFSFPTSPSAIPLSEVKGCVEPQAEQTGGLKKANKPQSGPLWAQSPHICLTLAMKEAQGEVPQGSF